jgi:acyl carrier protein
MSTQEFLRELEDVLEMPTGSIRGTEKLADLTAWDSMAAISFIAMADAKLGASVSADRLAACQSVADLAALFPGKVTA